MTDIYQLYFLGSEAMRTNLIYLVNLKPSSHRTAEESLGIQYLAAILTNRNFDVVIIDNWLDSSISDNDIFKCIKERKNEICFVGTSSYMLSNTPTLNLIKKLKDEGINVIAGGYGPTFEPKLFLDSGVDFVCIGDGETCITDISSFFTGELSDKSKIRGVAYLEGDIIIYTKKQDIAVDLNTLPFPLRPYLDLLKIRKSTVNVMTSRGCMGECSFCSVAAFNKKHSHFEKWRGRNIFSIVEELNQLSSMGVTTVKIIDDSFIENERGDKWCKDFADELKKRKISLQFRASIRADKVSAVSMEHLKRAGFISFSCGIENASKTALERMGKMATVENNFNALKIFKDNNIYVQAGYILFDNKTTINELKENCIFLSDNVHLISKGIFSEMFAAEGTEFTNALGIENNAKFSSNKLYKVNDPLSRIVHFYLKKWQSNHADVYDKVIDPISAPKALPSDSMLKYHDLMVSMKKIDIKFMSELIECVETNKDPNVLYASYFKKYNSFFTMCSEIVNKYYEDDGINYDADENSFVKHMHTLNK